MAATCVTAPVPCRLARTACELLLLPLLLLPPVVMVFLLVLEVVEAPDVPVVVLLLVFLEVVELLLSLSWRLRGNTAFVGCCL